MVNEIGCIHGGALPTQVSCKMTGEKPPSPHNGTVPPICG